MTSRNIYLEVVDFGPSISNKWLTIWVRSMNSIPSEFPCRCNDSLEMHFFEIVHTIVATRWEVMWGSAHGAEWLRTRALLKLHSSKVNMFLLASVFSRVECSFCHVLLGSSSVLKACLISARVHESRSWHARSACCVASSSIFDIVQGYV